MSASTGNATPTSREGRSAGSLRLRLLGATLVTLALALTGAHWWLGGLFRDHVMRQFDATLVLHLDQLTARLEFDAHYQPLIDPQGLTDPRFSLPYSGMYWQLDQMAGDEPERIGVLRSRSLWDTQLTPSPPGLLADGKLHWHYGLGPRGQVLRMAERSLQMPEQPQARWRLMVAADTHAALAASNEFNNVLTASLAGLGLLLALAALAQVSVGLAPLQGMQRSLQRVREGRDQRLQGRFPLEVQPLIDDFNSVLDRNTEVVHRARTQAGNLAHALKTPLAVLANAAEPGTQSRGDELAQLVVEQVQVAQRHINWHLARARVAAAHGLPGQRTPLQPVLENLLRVMSKVYADHHLDLSAHGLPAETAFAGEEQDLMEMLGNLLDNACRNARTAVRVQAQREGEQLLIAVDDDGPGIAPERRAAALQRGVRLDESKPGSGLGLHIVVELATLYGGALALESSPIGGLRARLALPAAA